MILREKEEVGLEIGGTMKIRYGSPINNYVSNSQSTAREVLQDDESPPEKPKTAGEVVSELTQ